MKKIRKQLLSLLLAGCFVLPALGCSQPQDAAEESPTLDGKKIIFIGDSFLFSGKAVLTNKGITVNYSPV